MKKMDVFKGSGLLSVMGTEVTVCPGGLTLCIWLVDLKAGRGVSHLPAFEKLRYNVLF